MADFVFYKELINHLDSAVLVINQDLTVRYLNPAAESFLQVSGRRCAGEPFHHFFLDASEELETFSKSIRHEGSFTKREATIILSNQQETLLLERMLDNPDLKEFTTIIIEEVDRLRNLVDKMLGPNKLPERLETNIHEVLERVRSLIIVEAEEKIKLHRDYDPSIPEFFADKEQLIQVVLNITRNAMQALLSKRQTNFPPEITLQTRTIRQFTIGHTKHRLVLHISIIDNGPGIPEEIRESLFFPMISGRPEGTGLGLSIAQSIINQHQGIIECESKPGQTHFSIYLPLELSPPSSNNGLKLQ